MNFIPSLRKVIQVFRQVTPPIIPSSWMIQLGAITKGFPGAIHSNDDFCTSIAVDSSGNVYCAGRTNGALGETNGGFYDAFVMKLNSSGVILWVTQLGNETEASSPHVNDTVGTDSCESVAVDSVGNVFCAGSTSGPLNEGNGGSADAFVMKLNSAGVIQWVRQFGSVTLPDPLYEGGAFFGIALDAAGTVYAGGEIFGTASEASGGGGSGDVFVVKIKPDGTLDL
jgi:hypothetical protein